jgi:hypothetical protein
MKPSTILLSALAPLWVLAIGGGAFVLMAYEHTPGTGASRVPAVFPGEIKLARAPARATLIMLVHPHCSCTRASIAELGKLMARCQSQLGAHVVFLKPESMPPGWEHTDIWSSAQAIPGVEVISDRDGAIARRFDATTSGQTVVYSSTGELIFAGGITAARGQVGDNAGSRGILQKLNGEMPGINTESVFGCPLATPQVKGQVQHDTGAGACPGKLHTESHPGSL